MIDGVTTTGAFFSFITALMMAYRPLKSLANLNTIVQEGMGAAQRLFDMLDTQPTIIDAPDAKPLKLSGGHVRLEGVTFRYDAADNDHRPALHGLDLDIPAGQTVALVGPSGAGKSTVMNMIPRFYDAIEGRVLIDGQDVRTVTLDSLRDAVALVSQEVVLFDDTVAANIGFGRPGGQPRGDRGRRAPCRRARVHHRVARWVRHHCGRAWSEALGRTAPALVHRARHAQERPHSAAGRGHKCA